MKACSQREVEERSWRNCTCSSRRSQEVPASSQRVPRARRALPSQSRMECQVTHFEMRNHERGCRSPYAFLQQVEAAKLYVALLASSATRRACRASCTTGRRLSGSQQLQDQHNFPSGGGKLISPPRHLPWQPGRNKPASACFRALADLHELINSV